MNNNRDQTNDLAMLAGMVKGNMRKIDSLMTDISDRPADNIDIHKFISAPQRPEPPQQYNIQQENVAPQQFSSPQSVNPVVSNVVDDELKQDIESIKLTLDKINGNLTKLTGMFGKVFQSLTSNKNG
jgi:hypothetical protein